MFKSQADGWTDDKAVASKAQLVARAPKAVLYNKKRTTDMGGLFAGLEGMREQRRTTTEQSGRTSCMDLGCALHEMSREVVGPPPLWPLHVSRRSQGGG